MRLGTQRFQCHWLVMQRLARAGVQPITYGGGLALGSRFRVGEIGRRRIDEALSTEIPISAYG
jgi:hypothetical protein